MTVSLEQLRRHYRDTAEFCFELSQAWLAHSEAGHTDTAEKIEGEYQRACESLHELGATIRSLEAGELMALAPGEAA